MADEVLIEKASGVLTLTLNRADKKNAITDTMYAALAKAVNDANEDREIRVVLIQGAGDSFTAGNDLAEFADFNKGGIPDSISAEPLLHALAAAKVPLIAAVHGRAVGIGLTMLLHCDLVFVAEDALLSSPFVNLALAPEAASSLLLPQRIGHVRAFALFALGQTIDGRTAAAWGIANEAVPKAEVHAKARAAAEQLAKRAPAAVAITKKLMREPDAYSARIDEELVGFFSQLRSDEAREAFAAFFEKRPADFSRF